MSAIVTTSGILVPLKNRGKDNKLIPWSLVKKETIKPAIKRCTAPKHGVDIYVVEKTVDGKKLDAVFETEREALRAVDIFLIENGREPEYILRRL
jgi:hypothetical protein